MIINTQSSNTGKRLSTGWMDVKIVDVSVTNNPNDYIRYKVTVMVTSPEISQVLSNGMFPVEIPVWNRQNSDGSYGGEYDLLNFYRATKAEEVKLEGNKTDIDLDSMKSRSLKLRFYTRPGSSYVDAHAKTAIPTDADQNYIDLKELQFTKDYNYLLSKYESKMASSPEIQLYASSPKLETKSSELEDKLPF